MTTTDRLGVVYYFQEDLKMVLKEKLLAAAVTAVISITSTTVFAANPAQYYSGANTATKKAIVVKGVHQKGPEQVPGLYMCSHTALKMAVSAFGVNKSLGKIHEELQALDSTYLQKSDACPWGSCPHIKTMEKLLWKYDRDGLGVSGAYESVNSAAAFGNRMKQLASEGKVAVVLSRTHNYGRGNIAHFYLVHGWRTENGKQYLYVRDPLIARSGNTDEHSITVEQWWEWMNRNGNIQFLRVGLR